MSFIQWLKDKRARERSTIATLQQFQDACATGGLEAGIDFVRSLSESQQTALIAAIELGGAGWVAGWLMLRLAEKGEAVP